MTRFGPDAALPRSVSKTAVATPLPTDALIDIKVRDHLVRFIPIRHNLDTITYLRISTIPQRRHARRGDVRRLCPCPDVVQYLPNVGAVGDERDDAHLLATQGAPQREHLSDAGHQHRPQPVRRALGWLRLGRPGLSWE